MVDRPNESRGGQAKRIVFLALCSVLLLPSGLSSGRLPNHHWELLAVSYPPDRDVSVVLGGAEKTLTSKGLCKVKWREDAARVEIEIEDLPPPQEIGWAGHQYVLWAIDSENRTLNLGVVPLHSKQAKWELSVPFRVFGLLVTAEKDSKREAPGSAVAMESLLPTDPFLVVPVFRVDVALTPSPPG